jgi:Ca-activated chloride channel family protein
MIRVRGKSAGAAREFTATAEFAARPKADVELLEGLWAERRVAQLLDQMRLHGQDRELVDEVRRLGTTYHIVTPFTSHLILEEGLAVSSGRPIRGVGGPSTPRPATSGAPFAPATSGGPSSLAGAPAESESARLDRIATAMQSAGVLPRDASREKLRELALHVAREIRDADSALRGLGSVSTGGQAVDDNVYLAQLIGQSSSGSDDFFMGRSSCGEGLGLAGLFTRRIADKNFDLRAGVWADRALTDEATTRTVVEAYSDAWFDLLARRPAIKHHFALSDRLVVLHQRTVYEVRPTLGKPGATDAPLAPSSR